MQLVSSKLGHLYKALFMGNNTFQNMCIKLLMLFKLCCLKIAEFCTSCNLKFAFIVLPYCINSIFSYWTMYRGFRVGPGRVVCILSSDESKGRRRMAKQEVNFTHMRKDLLWLLCVGWGRWCMHAYVCETVSRKKSKWGGIENEKEPRARQDNHNRSD